MKPLAKIRVKNRHHRRQTRYRKKVALTRRGLAGGAKAAAKALTRREAAEVLIDLDRPKRRGSRLAAFITL